MRKSGLKGKLQLLQLKSISNETQKEEKTVTDVFNFPFFAEFKKVIAFAKTK